MSRVRSVTVKFTCKTKAQALRLKRAVDGHERLVSAANELMRAAAQCQEAHPLVALALTEMRAALAKTEAER